MAREPATVVEMRRALGGMLKNLRIAADITQGTLARQVFRHRTTHYIKDICAYSRLR
jgi:hypothetical protein